MLAPTLLESSLPVPGSPAGSCSISRQPPVRAGAGRLEVALVDGRSAVVSCRATSPLQLLAPRARGAAAWVLAASHGGGLVTGDAVELAVEVGPGATAYLGTQAETKVYRAKGSATLQRLDAAVGAGGLLALLPDPVSPFAGSSHAQEQRFALAPGASLALLDAVTAGRAARGERWEFHRYASRNELRVGGTLLLADAVRLAVDQGPPLSRRLSGVELLATVVLVGPRVAAGAAALLRRVAELPADGAAPVLCAASPLADGAVLRLAARTVEDGMAAVRGHLSFLAAPLDGDPLLRRP
jgi:urease accessory protein